MYKIKLQHFEGPLDLLLFFIKRDELDIYDIPISRITKEFMEYLNLMKMMDLEVAGDFILMATTLMQIKVRMLLPKEVDEKGEVIDPRDDLVKALLDYKRYKEMSEELFIMEANQRKVFNRGYYEADEKESPPEYDVLLKNISIFDLLKAFKSVIAEKPKPVVHEIKKIPVSIEDQMEFILNLTKDDKEVPFIRVLKLIDEKIKIIVTFIALLELAKMQKIGIKESEEFNEFVIFRLEDGEDI